MNAVLEAVRDLGYYDCIQRDSRSIHVQTEVLGGEPLQIRTTVMDNGAVLDAVGQTYPPEEVDVDRVKKAAAAQHQRVVANVRQGKYD